MPKSDAIFKSIESHLPPASRKRAKECFIEAYEQYLFFMSGRMHDYDPHGGAKRNLQSERIVFTGGRYRRIRTYQQPKWQQRARGRRPNLPLEYFVSRLAFIWALANKRRTTLSHKGYQSFPTAYEEFMTAVLNAIEIKNVRKYLEIHSAARSKWRSATIY